MTFITKLLRPSSVLAAAVAASIAATPLAYATDDPAPSVDAAVPQDPVSAEIVSVLADSKYASEEALRAFYSTWVGQPIWVRATGGKTTHARALIAAFGAAADHALPLDRYGVEALSLAIEDAKTLQDRAEAELAFSKAFLLYARDVSSGLLEPRRADREILVRPERPEPLALMAKIAETEDPSALLSDLPPADPGYAALMQRLAEYRRLARSDAWAKGLRKGPTLRAGDRSERVVDLRRRLIAMGDLDPSQPTQPAQEAGSPDMVVAANDIVTDLPPQGTTDPAIFDPAVQAAVERFQARHGLNMDGVVGPATRAALNADPAERARQIAVNLERIRWLNKDLGRRHVWVNLAGFDMRLVEDGEAIFTSRVVIGKARRHRTPEFSDEMEYMVVNPTWHVPRSIATEEILPKLQADPTYLAQKNMRLVGADAELIDWEFVTPATFPGRVKQGPGPGNALGKVKFMFPNDHAIYLHDTPSKSLFRRDRRAYSHGCVRVQEPFEFAYHLLAPQEEDPQGYFDRLARRGAERYVNLDEHVPVHLAYRTAWVDADGSDQFRQDIYGRDKRVFAALEKAGVSVLAD
ncbi:MAG: L,D-transpeptidase family protein [Pseudomonadota bacterium]